MKKRKLNREEERLLNLDRKYKQTPRIDLVRYAGVGVAGILIVVLGNQYSYWVGIGIGSVLVLWGYLMFFHSSQYVRKAWLTELKLVNETNEQTREELRVELGIEKGYIDVNRNWGMALLTMAAGVLAITTIMSMIGDIPKTGEIIEQIVEP